MLGTKGRELASVAAALFFASGFQAVALAEEDQTEAKVVVPLIQVSGVDVTAAELLTDILLDALLNRHGIKAIGPSEIQQLLTVEAQKQLLGCSDSDCLAEIGGALEARYLISGRIGKLGSINILTLQLVDTQKAELAGRATVKLAQIEEAIDAVGPLTDKLLGRTFRAAKASEIAAFRARDEVRPDYEVMDKRTFCKKFDRYREALEKKPYDEGHPKTREALLYDIVLTPHKPRFDEKISCVKSSLFYVIPRLRGPLNGAKDEAAALDVRQRIAETAKMISELEIVEADYAMGIEKVKLNTGALPIKLSFTVKPGKVVVPDDSPEVKEYQRVYAHGQKLVERALKIGNSGTEADFGKLWAPKKDGKPRSLGYAFGKIDPKKNVDQRFDPCPWYVLSVRDIEGNAKLLAEKGQLKGCYRKRDGKGNAYLTNVTMVKHEGKWRFDRM